MLQVVSKLHITQRSYKMINPTQGTVLLCTLQYREKSCILMI